MAVMADVIRGKSAPFSKNATIGYAFHGVTAIIAIALVIKALNS